MEPIFKSYFEELEALHGDCKEQISGLTQEELDWSPGEDMNSLAILAAHIAGAERYWISDIVMGEASGRVREDEFATEGSDENALFNHLDAALESTRDAFGTLTLDQLTETRKTPRGDREYTVAWSVAHVLDHTALHLGHMQITRQLVKSRTTE